MSTFFNEIVSTSILNPIVSYLNPPKRFILRIMRIPQFHFHFFFLLFFQSLRSCRWGCCSTWRTQSGRYFINHPLPISYIHFNPLTLYNIPKCALTDTLHNAYSVGFFSNNTLYSWPKVIWIKLKRTRAKLPRHQSIGDYYHQKLKSNLSLRNLLCESDSKFGNCKSRLTSYMQQFLKIL